MGADNKMRMLLLNTSGFSPMVNVTLDGTLAYGAALEGVRYGGPRPN